jgi:hypothetical protein
MAQMSPGTENTDKLTTKNILFLVIILRQNRVIHREISEKLRGAGLKFKVNLLIASATAGNTVAIAVLAILGAMVLIGFGAIITLWAVSLAARREQANFMANVKENISIMYTMQRVLNAQNTQLLRLAQKAGQLPSLGSEGYNLVEVDDSIFDVLDE